MHSSRVCAAGLALLLVVTASARAADVHPTTAPAHLVPDSTGGPTIVSGSVRGYASRDYLLHAGAGQTLAVDLKIRRGSPYFNVLPPGSDDVAMFVGSTSGMTYRGIAPIAGEYMIRVYLMRSSARRNTLSEYTLTAGVSGASLVPLSPSEDAVLPGTPFHARAPVRCSLPYQPEVHTCEASVIRYGRDGTATVEFRGPSGFVRRILFVKGAPSASDATEPPASTHDGDTTIVHIGSDERFEVPDALIFGG